MRNIQSARRPRSGGFTLLEMTVVVAVLGVVLSSVGLFQARGNEAARSQMSRAELQARASRALSRIATELHGAAQSRLQPDPDDEYPLEQLNYERIVGLDGGVATWTEGRLAVELEPGEQANGMDDDGDGLVDERRLRLVHEVGSQGEGSAILCDGLPAIAPGEVVNGVDDDGDGAKDEAGFGVRRVGELLLVHLALQEPQPSAAPLVVEVSTAVVLRN